MTDAKFTFPLWRTNMNFKKFITVIAASSTLFGMAACSDTDAGSDSKYQTVPVFDPLTEKVDPYEAPYCRTASGEMMTEQDWADASNDFSLELLKKNPKSSVISAYSIERAVGMLYEGACHETAGEILKVLEMPEADNLSETGKKIQDKMFSGNGEKAQIYVDNHLWIEKTYKVRDIYANALKAVYGTPTAPLDFASQPENSRLTINHYISTFTHDKINDLLPENSITASTRLVLTNAVYFKDKWRNEFEPKYTEPADFRTGAGTVKVDMMHNIEKYGYIETDRAQIISLPYKNSHYSFMVVLPKVEEGDDVVKALTAVEDEMSAESLRKNIKDMSTYKVTLRLPKFKQTTDLQLKDILISLGMEQVFDPEKSDLSAIPAPEQASRPYVSDIFHKAFIEVTEEGTEAAAATGGAVAENGVEIENRAVMTVDHPFMYAIMDDHTGTALFMGHVFDIQQ